ncbi:adenylate cyclase [Burkholderia sp. MSMB1078WGS]|uniref:poly(ethylene terephthalate) hydrolase family protein n=1 Tax=Burkholderia sp. MSMB1078WGS TaxID=1637900 RepID=UPI0009E70242|nr:adenylate cyclase [Burkholderia sp. MSMB1078WGS]
MLRAKYYKRLILEILIIFSLISPAYSGASELFQAVGLANEQYAKQQGPFDIATNAVVSDCRGFLGIIAKIVASAPNLTCGTAFPYGFSSPVSTAVYYPTDIANLSNVPAVVFVGGILSNTGQYNDLLRLWASYGFVVFTVGDFINSTPAMHLLGLYELSKLNNDPTSPLFGKIDLSHTVIAGHSAGAQATLQTASLPIGSLKIISNSINIVGALPIEPGPLALGSLVTTKTLMLTGAADTVVPAITWPNIWELPTIQQVPAWGATATTATHFSPVHPIYQDEFAGISTAWILYAGKGDSEAKKYFVGDNFKLSQDPQFIQGGLGAAVGLGVSRNTLAKALVN